MAKMKNVDYLIGLVILIVLATALAPTIFTNINALNTSDGTPTWVKAVMFVIAGAAIVLLVWRASGN